MDYFDLESTVDRFDGGDANVLIELRPIAHFTKILSTVAILRSAPGRSPGECVVVDIRAQKLDLGVRLILRQFQAPATLAIGGLGTAITAGLQRILCGERRADDYIGLDSWKSRPRQSRKDARLAGDGRCGEDFEERGAVRKCAMSGMEHFEAAENLAMLAAFDAECRPVDFAQ